MKAERPQAGHLSFPFPTRLARNPSGAAENPLRAINPHTQYSQVPVLPISTKMPKTIDKKLDHATSPLAPMAP